ncbi:MAG: hypothetical protein L0312_14485 [Acidobacteria bacterium]|nr:hypothetical protein [Acidobacteriota bacterium]
MPVVRFEAIGANKRYDTRLLKKEIDKAVDKTTKAALDDFKKTTRTWEKKPPFEQVKAHDVGSDTVGAAGTNNKIYRFVTRGTRAHVIKPKRKTFLRFRSVYRAKTTRRVIGSKRGGASGELVFTRKPVLHPGTEAREFEEEISARHQVTLENNVTAAVLRATTPK